MLWKVQESKNSLVKVISHLAFLRLLCFEVKKKILLLNLPIKCMTKSRLFSMEAPTQREILGHSGVCVSKESLACGSFVTSQHMLQK